jgi:hypothetical protein
VSLGAATRHEKESFRSLKKLGWVTRDAAELLMPGECFSLLKGMSEGWRGGAISVQEALKMQRHASRVQGESVEKVRRG